MDASSNFAVDGYVTSDASTVAEFAMESSRSESRSDRTRNPGASDVDPKIIAQLNSQLLNTGAWCPVAYFSLFVYRVL